MALPATRVEGKDSLVDELLRLESQLISLSAVLNRIEADMHRILYGTLERAAEAQ